MKSFPSAVTLTLLAISALLGPISPAVSRSVFEDAWGVATDPIQLGKASSNFSASLERTLIQLNLLESRANYDVQERLEQIRSIVKDAIAGVDNAADRMMKLEAAINRDAVNLIYRAQCAAEVVLMDQAQRSFAQLISNLKKADPGVTILGIRIVDLSVGDIKIESPDRAYLSTKAAQLSLLRKTVTDTSKAYDILSAYQNLARAAHFTRCYYMDQASETRWVEEVNELERLSLPWVLIVKPTM